MLTSLRTRLMLVSAGLSGIVLAVFAGWTYARLYEAGIKEIDGQLRDLGERFLLQPMQAEQWTNLERSLSLLSGSDETRLMLIKGRQGEIVAQSTYWPEDLSPDRFEAPPTDPYAPMQYPGPGRFDGRRPPDAPRWDPDRPPPPRRGGMRGGASPGEPRWDGRGPPPRRGGMRGGPPPGGPRWDGQGPPPRRQSPRGGRGFDPMRPPPRDPNIFGQVLNNDPSPSFKTPFSPIVEDSSGFEPRHDDRPKAEFGAPPPPPPRRDGRRRGGRRGQGPFPPPPLRSPVFSTIKLPGGTWRIGEMGAPHATLVAGIRLDRFRGEMADLRTAFLSASGLALLGIIAGAWAVSNQALRPIRGLSAAIERVSVRGLHERVPEETRDPELRQLTLQFNAMMARLEGSFTQAARFSADAAHELKTPLAILQGHLEEALRKEPAASGELDTYSKLLEEVQRLKSIVSKLLLLSRADAGRLNIALAPLDFSVVVNEICEDTKILAPTLDISAEVGPGIQVDADEALLRQVLHNICSNAIRYNRPRGKIRCRLRTKGNTAIFGVWNTGSPIPPADRERVFDRFYRADTSRARNAGGAGLGLSLAREIARAHGGNLTLESPKEGWNGFRLTLPLSQGIGRRPGGLS